MKTVKRLILILALVFGTQLLRASETELTGGSVASDILSSQSPQDIISRAIVAIDELLANPGITARSDREKLANARTSFVEMRDAKTCAGTGAIIELTAWIRSRQNEIAALKESELHDLTPEQRIYADSKLFTEGFDAGLSNLLRALLGAFLEIDGDASPSALLEANLQLYLNLRDLLEEDSYALPDRLLLKSPKFIRARFPKLTSNQKQNFLKDVNEARRLATIETSDSELAAPITADERATYESSYQFILSNMPQ